METATTIHASDANAQFAPVSKGRLWTGRIMSALPALFLFVDSVGKLVKPAPVVEGTVQLGYPESVLLGLGIVLLTCTVLYVIPRTAVLGAISADRLSRRRHRHACASGKSALQPHFIPGLCRTVDLGWALPAR